MNKERRERIAVIEARISELKTDLEAIRDEEHDAYDNLPYTFAEGEQGQKMQDCIEALDQAISACEDAENYLSEATE